MNNLEICVGDLVVFKNRARANACALDHLGNMIPDKSLCLITDIVVEKSYDSLDRDDWINYSFFIPDENIFTSGWGEKSIQKIDVRQKEK